MVMRVRVEEFVRRIERGEFLEVMPEFYAEHGTAQENNAEPRVGLAAMMANEKGALERWKFTHIEAKSIVVEGDCAVTHYIFEMQVIGTDQRARLEEIAWQVWKNDKTVSERSFDDPAQRVPN